MSRSRILSQPKLVLAGRSCTMLLATTNMRRESHDFDALVVDAFSRDSIPAHLLTRQAMELYLQRIRNPQSVIAFHLSNSSLDLRPLMDSFAYAHRTKALVEQSLEATHRETLEPTTRNDRDLQSGVLPRRRR